MTGQVEDFLALRDQPRVLSGGQITGVGGGFDIVGHHVPESRDRISEDALHLLVRRALDQVGVVAPDQDAEVAVWRARHHHLLLNLDVDVDRRDDDAVAFFPLLHEHERVDVLDFERHLSVVARVDGVIERRASSGDGVIGQIVLGLADAQGVPLGEAHGDGRLHVRAPEHPLIVQFRLRERAALVVIEGERRVVFADAEQGLGFGRADVAGPEFVPNILGRDLVDLCGHWSSPWVGVIRGFHRLR